MARTWLFQAVPSRFRINEFLESSPAEFAWLVAQHKNEIAVGDTVFLWRAKGNDDGKLAGIVAEARVASPPSKRRDDSASKPFWVDAYESRAVEERVVLKVIRTAGKREILRRDWLKEDPILADLSIFRFPQGTNFAVDDDQSARIRTLWAKIGSDWSRDEAVAGLWAYSKTHGQPVSKLLGSPVSEVSLRIGRVVTGVYNKVMNFRFLDPRDGRQGMSGGGIADELVWEEFYDPISSTLNEEALHTEYERLWGGNSASAQPLQIFATRVWGFDPITWPIIGFGRDGDRDSLLRKARPGDLIIFVATKNENVESEDQGRVLGMAEIGRIPVNSLDLVKVENTGPHDYKDGKFKWPKALPIIRAWEFPTKPEVKELLGRQLPYNATSQAVLLTPEEALKVLALGSAEIKLPKIDVLEKARFLLDALKPTRGPQPTAWSGSVTRAAPECAYTYVFRFGHRNVWKVGWSADVKKRLEEVNKHIPTEVLKEGWRSAYTHRFGTQEAAYAMEQAVLTALAEYRTSGERVVCAEAQIQQAWMAAVVG